MRLRTSAVGIAVLAVVAVRAPAAPTIDDIVLQRPEGARHYLRAGPTGGRHPLVILLHGHGGSARQLLGGGRGAAPLAVWLDIGAREGLAIAAPDGTEGADGRRGWDDCRADNTQNPRADDVGFIAALIDHEAAAGADPARVYVMGMSNGGMMAFRLAIELAPRIAAFGAVSASMAGDSRCPPPSRPLPALIVAGTADPLVPWGGGAVRLRSTQPRGTVIAVEQAVRIWCELARLSPTPQVRHLPHRDGTDTTRAQRVVWGDDRGGLQVELLRIEGGGHVEPSLSQHPGRLYLAVVGPQNRDLEVAEEAWDFFRTRRAAAAR